MALDTTHESFIDNFGRARLYYSTLSELKFSNRFLDYLDCSEDNPEEREVAWRQQNLQSYSPVMTTVKKPLDLEPLGTPNTKGKHQDIETQHSTPNVNNWYFGAPMTPIIFQNRFIADHGVGLKPIDSLSAHTERSIPSANEIEPSKVVLFSNIDDIFKTALEIFNLFSCFGNIRKVLFMKNIRKAMMEYENVEYAQNCLIYMNNRPFCSSKIKVNFSKYKKIDLKKNNKSENSQNFNEVLIVLPQMNRYEALNLSVVTPPSSSIVIGYPKMPGIELVDVNLLVQSFAKPLSSRMLDEAYNFESSHQTSKVLFQFSSIAEAMLVVTKAHNFSINGSVIKAHFTPKTA
jgi:hypothetical protein